MKKTVMIKAYYLVDLEEEEITKENGLLDKSCNAVMKNYSLNGVDITWNAITTLVLDPSELNAGKCNNCGCWISDKDKAGFIEGLNVGINDDGVLLCDECLSAGHIQKF